MSLKLCPTCKGAREFVGLGMMNKKCDECNGVGRLVIEDVIQTPVQEESQTPKKRSGRPKKHQE